MSGSTPYPARSPTQPYPPYSPTHPNRPYYSHEYQQIAPPPPHVMQTPPPFAPASLAHSPHQGRSLASPLSALNNGIPPAPNSATTYQQHTSSPPYLHQRSYSGHLVQSSMPPPYEGTPSGHGHPPSRQGSMLQSPIREQYPIQNGIVRDNLQSDASPPSKEVSHRHELTLL
jgi:hypothetical protein